MELPVLEPITIKRGLTDMIELDLGSFDFADGSVEFIVRDYLGNMVLQAFIFPEMVDEFGFAYIEVEPQDSKDLTPIIYHYEVLHILEDQRYAQISPSPFIVKETIGGIHHG